jgi:hypothetical protein
MKIALLALLGLMLGTLGGAALGIGAGLAWIEIFKTSDFEGYSGMLVFFTFMPLGAIIGGLGGALLFGVMAVRDNEIAIEREPARRHDSQEKESKQKPRAPTPIQSERQKPGPHPCNAKLQIAIRPTAYM